MTHMYRTHTHRCHIISRIDWLLSDSHTHTHTQRREVSNETFVHAGVFKGRDTTIQGKVNPGAGFATSLPTDRL